MGALRLLSLAYFVQGTAALSVIAALPAIGAAWGIDHARGARLMTAFGLTFALAAPAWQMVIGHWQRRRQILLGLALLALGAAGFALAPNYGALLGSRVAMGLGAALISPVLGALGSSIVAPAQQGRALAIVITGLSVSAVAGIPLCAWIADAFGPRAMFGIVALAAVACLLLVALRIGDDSAGRRVRPAELAALLATPSTLSGLAVVALIAAAVYAMQTMLVPVLQEQYGAGGATVSSALLLFGLAGLAGNLLVRRLAARHSAERLLAGAMLALGAMYCVVLAVPHAVAPMALALVAWPVACDIIWPSLQRRTVELEPAQRAVALALNASFLFTGIGAGAALGGAAYERAGYRPVLLVSTALVLAALGVLAWSRRAQLRAVAAA